MSEEAIELLRQLLAMRYLDGGVPLPIIALVETSLKSIGKWFPDPQYPYHETHFLRYRPVARAIS